MIKEISHTEASGNAEKVKLICENKNRDVLLNELWGL
jgi:hypothetical protein